MLALWLAGCAFDGATAPLPPKTVLAWWGPGTNDSLIDKNIAWFASRRHAITTASVISHRLGPNGTLQALPVGGGRYTTPSLFRALRSKGVRVLPIIYNDESYGITLLPKLRALFAAPEPFIANLTRLAEEHDLDGFNLDFEIGVRCPTCKGPENATREDARQLGRFIDKLATSLGPQRTVSLDMMTWDNPLWAHPVLNRSKLGRAVDMSTYGNAHGDPDDFRRFVVSAGKMIEDYSEPTSGACPKIGIGLCPACLNRSRPFTSAQLQARFDLIGGLECVREIDMWSERPHSHTAPGRHRPLAPAAPS